jgi:hypothetical protein
MEKRRMGAVRDQLIEDLKRLSEDDLAVVRDFVRVLLEEEEDLTAEEAAEFDAGREEIARGEWARWEDVRRTDV